MGLDSWAKELQIADSTNKVRGSGLAGRQANDHCCRTWPTYEQVRRGVPLVCTHAGAVHV